MPKIKNCYVDRKILKTELKRFAANNFLDRYTQVDLIKDLNKKGFKIAANKVNELSNRPITRDRALMLAEHFDVTLEYLAGLTPFRNSFEFENSTINQNRNENINFLHRLGFVYHIGASVIVTWEQYCLLSNKEKDKLKCLICSDWGSLLDNFNIDDDLLVFPLHDYDLENYKKGLDKYFLEFKNTSLRCDYIVSSIDDLHFQYLLDDEMEKFWFTLKEFDDYMIHIKELISNDMNKKGYLV